MREHAVTAIELQQSEQRFRTLVEASPLAISLIGKNGMYKYVNPRFMDMFGYTLDDLPSGRHWFKKAFPEKHIRNQALLSWHKDLKKVVSGDAASRTFNVTCKDQTQKRIKFRPVIIENNDCLMNYEDTTEQFDLEAQLRQAQKMEALGTLTGGIAHDFNNILSIIIGYSEMAILKENDHPLARKGLREIRKASFRGKDVVRHLLTFIRKTEQEQKIINIIPVVKESIKMLRATISSNIDIDLAIPDELPFIRGDLTQIHQVIVNLSTNASHAMTENGGTITIRCDHLFLENAPEGFSEDIFPGDFVKLIIRDTGKGISETNMDRIFDPYFTTKDSDQGSGLGLSVVLGIVKSHKGGIQINSVIHQGTCVEILLPTTSGQPEEIPEKTNQILPVGNENILVVDDEQMIVDLSCDLLTQLGYSATGITHPQAALDLFKDNPGRFDLVLTDMGMPFMTGEDLSIKLLQIRPDLPIILCTGFSETMTKDKAIGIGIKKYIEKPLNPVLISESVRRVLDQSG